VVTSDSAFTKALSARVEAIEHLVKDNLGDAALARADVALSRRLDEVIRCLQWVATYDGSYVAESAAIVRHLEAMAAPEPPSSTTKPTA
jgi:hypothetical protein